jgi:hypothetical protein
MISDAVKILIFGSNKQEVCDKPSRSIDLDRIANSIEKVDRMILRMKHIGNRDGLATWQIVRNRLRLEWEDAMLSVHTDVKRNYQFLY